MWVRQPYSMKRANLAHERRALTVHIEEGFLSQVPGLRRALPVHLRRLDDCDLKRGLADLHWFSSVLSGS